MRDHGIDARPSAKPGFGSTVRTFLNLPFSALSVAAIEDANGGSGPIPEQARSPSKVGANGMSKHAYGQKMSGGDPVQNSAARQEGLIRN